MDRKRKLPARASARSGLSKKRTLTPLDQAPTALPAHVVEEPLPKSIAGGKPLPTIEQPQPDDLPTSRYQTVAESGVLAESLERSRKRWLIEGVLEKYWTKTSKKKAISAEEQASNPAKDTMTKMGTCTIKVEPACMEAVMFAVQDPNPRQVQVQQPMHGPIFQYGPPQPFQHPLTPQIHHPHAQPGTPTAPQPTNNHGPASMLQSPNGHLVSQQSPHAVIPASASQPIPKPQINTAPSPAPTGKSADPVIQMLAERAASDQDLKALMRIVADGKASGDELKKFQTHIDELTKMLQARQAAAAPSSSSTHPPSNARPPLPQSTPNARLQASPVTNGRPDFPVQPQPQALRSKGPVRQSKPDTTAVVFELIGGTGDRFLFPKYSMLEYLPGGRVIASFLLVRKGSSAESKRYDPTLDYYEPITMTLYALQGRQLDSLAKVVAPRDEVQKYMDDIMDNMTRAEYVVLAMRLPREVEQPVEVERASTDAQHPLTQPLWTASSNLPLIKQKPVRKALTEEEQHQAFIASVSSSHL